MTRPAKSRRAFLVGAGIASATVLTQPFGLLSPAHAQTSIAATESMRGGSNNYSPNAPLVDNLGQGFLVHGTVRQAGAGEPLGNVRIQIWAATFYCRARSQ